MAFTYRSYIWSKNASQYQLQDLGVSVKEEYLYPVIELLEILLTSLFKDIW